MRFYIIVWHKYHKNVHKYGQNKFFKKNRYFKCEIFKNLKKRQYVYTLLMFIKQIKEFIKYYNDLLFKKDFFINFYFFSYR